MILRATDDGGTSFAAVTVVNLRLSNTISQPRRINITIETGGGGFIILYKLVPNPVLFLEQSDQRRCMVISPPKQNIPTSLYQEITLFFDQTYPSHLSYSPKKATSYYSSYDKTNKL